MELEYIEYLQKLFNYYKDRLDFKWEKIEEIIYNEKYENYLRYELLQIIFRRNEIICVNLGDLKFRVIPTYGSVEPFIEKSVIIDKTTVEDIFFYLKDVRKIVRKLKKYKVTSGDNQIETVNPDELFEKLKFLLEYSVKYKKQKK